MSDAADAQFTTEELLSSAQGNATAFVLSTIAYLKEHDLAVDDYVRFFGNKFAPGWEELRDQPIAVARAVARNAVSVGGTLQKLSGDEEHAEAIIEGWPDEEISATLGLQRGEGEAMWDSFDPIMEHIGIRYSWGHEEDGAVRLTFQRRNA
jgi:hypothetical protein